MKLKLLLKAHDLKGSGNRDSMHDDSIIEN